MILSINLLVVAIALLIFGVGYAALIYWRPFGPGWTWLSVVVGVALTVLGEMSAIVMVLSHYNLQWLNWIALFAPAAFLLTGMPMIISQDYKRRKQNSRNNKIRDQFDD